LSALIAEFEIWVFLAGLGIFLFGMHMMEESIRVLSGVAFMQLIRRYTASRIKAILSGLTSTAILQSSSAVSLLVLAFTGAGIMNLVQAISVMMGAKIGTTFTAWVVAVFGFSFNIDAFSLPMIGIGGLGIILLAKSPRYKNISTFLVAFGFLFMGLDYMKSSVDQFSTLIDPGQLAGYGILLYAFTGLVLTAIMQSSSATIAIVLTMLHSGVIDFGSGAAMVIGANVGTTVTVILGSIGEIYIKKQAAVAQLIFTTVTAVAGLLLLPLLTWVVLSFIGFSDNIVLGLAMFHTLFNLFGVIGVYPFIPRLATRVESWIREDEIQFTKYIHKTDPEIAEAGIVAFKKEIQNQLIQTIAFVSQKSGVSKKGEKAVYADLEKYHADIFSYYTKIHAFAMEEQESASVDMLLRASRNLMNAAKNIYDAQTDLATLKSEPDSVSRTATDLIQKRIKSAQSVGNMLPSISSRKKLLDARIAVEELYVTVEKLDKELIQSCSHAVADKSIQKLQITHILMLNRTITQTCRMIIFAMRTLLDFEKPGEFQELPENGYKDA